MVSRNASHWPRTIAHAATSKSPRHAIAPFSSLSGFIWRFFPSTARRHALLLAGEIKLSAEQIDHDAKRPLAPPPGPRREYGKVLASVCTGCHGFGFSGGKIPGAPPEWPASRNITPDKETGIGNYDFEDFKRVLRTGYRKNGDKLSEVMPYKFYKDMSDDDIKALWLYLRTIEPKPAGGR